MNKGLEEIKQEAKVKVRRKTDRGKIGFGIAVVAMFSILVLQNSNLTTVLGRRSPFMEYTVCYNERDSAERKAYRELITLYISPTAPNPQVVLVKTKAYNDANTALSEANDLQAENHCPGLEVLKDR